MKALPIIAAMLLATPLMAQDAAAPATASQAQTPAQPQLSLEQRTTVRCGIAFAFVAAGQDAGVPEMQAYPAMEPRGKEFFVRAMARLIDETGLTGEEVESLVRAEAQAMLAEDNLADVMPACLSLLEASSL